MESAFSAHAGRKRAHLIFADRCAHVVNALGGAVWLALGLLLCSCSSAPPMRVESLPAPETGLPLEYAIVCIIHGDGSYGFHDSEGREYKADEQALAGAQQVAERNSQAEVFIFHEKHRRHTLLFFPRSDGEFYYYRNGRLIAQESYWRDHGLSRFDPVVDRFNRFHVTGSPRQLRLFLYFGHEIPEMGGKGYDASYRNWTFTIHDLADGLGRITRDSTRFDLVALSSCFGGTPHTISALTPQARYIIASPGNLHLSYLDLQPFEALDVGLRAGDVSAFATECARRSFARLTEDLQTEITVAVYDVDRVQGFVASVDSAYDCALSVLQGKAPTGLAHCDCADDSAYVRPAMSEGVEVFYRPARFGRSAGKLNHSGWECLQLLKQ